MTIKTKIVVTADDTDHPDSRGPVVWYSRVVETGDVTELARFGQELGEVLERYMAVVTT